MRHFDQMFAIAWLARPLLAARRLMLDLRPWRQGDQVNANGRHQAWVAQ